MINIDGVKSFVGCDAHSVTCSLKSYSVRGKEQLCTTVPTKISELQKAVSRLKHPVWIAVESCPMAAFVSDALEQVVDRIIVCDTRDNPWISKSENKSDLNDADKLARRLRMGECKPIYFPLSRDRDLQELMKLERKATADIVRAKNRLKDIFRRNGILAPGQKIYEKDSRDEFINQIKNKTILFKIKILFGKLDVAQKSGAMVEKRLHATLKHYRPYRLLQAIPGIGPKISVLLISTVLDPFRFKTKQKLWKYSGLSIRSSHSGSEKKVKKGGSKSGNRILKYAIMQAAMLSIRGDNYFSKKYNILIKRGVKHVTALRTIARKLLATVWSIWKNETKYCEPVI